MTEAMQNSVELPARRFRPYPQYKDSGVEWLGRIPGHWHVKRLKYVAPVSDERVYPSMHDIPYVALEHIESGTGKLKIDVDAHPGDSTASIFRPGDVLLGKLRPYLAKVLRVDFPGACSTELLVLRSDGEISPPFLAYQIISTGFIRWIDSMTYGTKMPRANPNQVANTEITLAPTEEQCAIATFLDQETEKIDALMAQKERLIELLQEKRTALITRAVTKGLDPNVPMKDSGVEWLGKIPTDWDVKRIKWVARMESGHTPDKKVAAYWEHGDIPWISLNDTDFLKDHDYISETAFYTNELGLQNSSARLLPERTVVFSRDATIGRCAIIARPMAVSQHFIAWICGDQMLPEYLLQVFRAMTNELERLTMGATLRTIGMPDVMTLATPLPPKREQYRIVDHIQNERSKLDALSSRVQEGINAFREFRTALISAAVTGKIDVRDAVP
jgi:type I restriction enzyme S subunit